MKKKRKQRMICLFLLAALTADAAGGAYPEAVNRAGVEGRAYVRAAAARRNRALEQPGVSAQLEASGQPGVSTQPEVSGQPGATEQPGVSAQPEASGQPGTPEPPRIICIHPVFRITLKKPVIKSLASPKKKSLKVCFGKIKKAIYYRVEVAKDKKFTKAVVCKTVTRTKLVIKGLKSKKKYYVRVRAYGRSFNRSEYSKVKSKKIS